jgi:hypothetical protein
VLGTPAAAEPPAPATTSGSTSTTSGSTSTVPASSSRGDDGGLNGWLLAPGAALLVLAGLVLIVAARRGSRARRNSR